MKATLDDASTALLEARKGHVAEVQAQWGHELLAALAGDGSVLGLLAYTRYLDAAWKALGVEPDKWQYGQAYLKEQVVRAIHAA